MSLTKIKYSIQALDVFESEISEFGEIETGGVLVGYIDKDTIFVEKASNGGKNAIHEELYFKADPNYVDMFIDIEVANSGSKFRYIGEWHTHPEVEPTPSFIDLQSLDEIAESSNDFCILLVIGNKGFKNKSFSNQSISLIQKNGDDKVYILKVSDNSLL